MKVCQANQKLRGLERKANQEVKEKLKYRESMIKYAIKNGVTKAARQYKVSRKTIYKWKKRYLNDPKDLKDRPTNPGYHPNQHTKEEIELIKKMLRRNKDIGIVRLWIKLRGRGYTRSISGLYNVMIRLGIYKKRKNKKKKKIPKYIQMTYPGERLQVDIKYVPNECVTNSGGFRYYQYTAIDEYSRYRIIEIYNSNTTYEAYKFIKKVIKQFPYKIQEIRTDNGLQFTNRLVSKTNKLTMFERYLREVGIKHDKIKPFTPKHNGKVERSHRKDEEWFYRDRKFYSLEDIRKQMRVYLREYNKFPMKPLNWESPIEKLKGGSQDKARAGVN